MENSTAQGTETLLRPILTTAAAATRSTTATHRAAAAIPIAAKTASPSTSVTTTTVPVGATRNRATASAEKGGTVCVPTFYDSAHTATSVAIREGGSRQQQHLSSASHSSTIGNSTQQLEQQGLGKRHHGQQNIQPRQQQQHPTLGSCPIQQFQHPHFTPLRQQQSAVQQAAVGKVDDATPMLQQQPHGRAAQKKKEHEHEGRIEKGLQKLRGGLQLELAGEKEVEETAKDKQQQGSKRKETKEKRRRQDKERERTKIQQQDDEEREMQQQQQSTQEEKEEETMKWKQQQANVEAQERPEQTEEEHVEECNVSGSGIQTVGGETPVEQSPEEKFVVEKDTLLCESILWKMLQEYYKQAAIAAWSQEVVPSFVTSNSRLCRSYARIIFGFIQDWYIKAKKERKERERKERTKRQKGKGIRKNRLNNNENAWQSEEDHQGTQERQQRVSEHELAQEMKGRKESRHQAALGRQQRDKETYNHIQNAENQKQQEQKQQEQQQQWEGRQQRQLDGKHQSDIDKRRDQVTEEEEREKEKKAPGNNWISKKRGEDEDEQSDIFGWDTARSGEEDIHTRPGTRERLIWHHSLPSTDNNTGSGVSIVAAGATPVVAGDGAVSTAVAAPGDAEGLASSSPCAQAFAAAGPSTTIGTTRLPAASACCLDTSISPTSSSSFRSVAPAGCDIPSLTATTENNPPALIILEIGGGHGRFTYLLLRALLQFRDLFEDLELPSFPFLYVFSDIAAANVCFCEKHPALQDFVAEGWLDFAIFDGNESKGEIFLRKRKKYVAKGTPIVAIANYVFDSLLTDAWR